MYFCFPFSLYLFCANDNDQTKDNIKIVVRRVLNVQYVNNTFFESIYLREISRKKIRKTKRQNLFRI